MAKVVTYSFAYAEGEVDLCEEHGSGSHALGYALGPAEVGARWGTCEVCQEDAIRSQWARIRAAFAAGPPD